MFVLHMLLSFTVAALAVVHISIIHNNICVSQQSEPKNYINKRSLTSTGLVKVPDLAVSNLYPIYFIKDLFIIAVTVIILGFLIIYYPEYFSNYIN